MQMPRPARVPRSPIQASPATTVLEMTSPSRMSTSLARAGKMAPPGSSPRCSPCRARSALAVSIAAFLHGQQARRQACCHPRDSHMLFTTPP